MSNPLNMGGWGNRYYKPAPAELPRHDPTKPMGQPQSTVPEKPLPGTSSTTPGGSTAPSAPSTLFDQSAWAVMSQMLDQYGLGTLSGTLKNLLSTGMDDQNEIQLALMQTPEWKQRFAGNEALRSSGLPVLSVSEYLATEKSYAQVMKQYGLPQGFYDDPSDFAKFIGNEVSPAELNQRASMYADLSNREDPALTQQLQSMGMSQGDLMAYMMDPTRAMPLLQKKYTTGILGASARRAGVVADNGYLGHLADMGINEQQAAQGFGQIGQELPTFTALAKISGTDLGVSDLERATFDNDSDATMKVNRLASQERARFNGSSGIASGSLERSSAGSY